MKENGKEFKVGDKAVYPAHGVGVIESIENKEFSGIKRTFYMLRILDNDITIMIPTENIDTVGLRDIISTKEIPRVYEILKNRKISAENQTWNRRYREYMEKIKTGSVFEVAEVLRDLILIKIDKDLSFGERRILNIAKNLLVKELSIAKDISEECIRQDLEDIFNC
ncbi:MAG: CarD family transcriptional regulator [Deltaproteobacteria bacterium]|nr:CarD family transcriptional regulator [Deltaproteobacteria bacterium]